MKEDGKAKQQIVDHIKDVSNILITVSQDPSVDELSAALGLTLMLNKMDKYGTAVFSGTIPPAIEFLKPDKTFRDNVDNLRDFIVALDKEKADRLRYKVEDDLVRIFITPYKEPISEDDLEYSYGDFNVELVIAIGVEKREELDKAITAHGRILHDATVVTINTKGSKSDLGSTDWQDPAASSYSEMLMSLSEALKNNLLDEQISNALLTGIVSATDRFSNTHTTPRVMTMAAQLMAAGANQQLIATRLEEAEEISPSESGETEDKSEKPEAVNDDGSLEINHSKDEEEKSDELDKALSKNGPKSGDSGKLSMDDLKKDLEDASKESESDSRQELKGRSSWKDKDVPPMVGGTLNATAAEAEEARKREEQESRNKVILKHGGTVDPLSSKKDKDEGSKKANGATLADLETAIKKRNGKEGAEDKSEPEEKIEAKSENKKDELPPPPSAEEIKPPELKEESGQSEPPKTDVHDARKEVEDALNAMPFNPANNPAASIGAQPLPMPPPPPMPDFSQLPPPPPIPSVTAPGQTPASPPPTPTAKPVAPPPIPAASPAPQASAPPAPTSGSDPTQFRIPGQ